MIPAEPLEEAFMREFEHIYYDPEKLETAIGERGERYKEIQGTIKILNERLEGIKEERKDIAVGIRTAKGDEKLIKDLVADSKKLAEDEKKIEDHIKGLKDEIEGLPDIGEIKKLMNSRLPAIQKELKKSNGLKGYSFDEKKKLLSHIFPPSSPRYRKYGITVWELEKGHYSFRADCLLDKNLLAEIYETDKGWKMDGGYSKIVDLECLEMLISSLPTI